MNQKIPFTPAKYQQMQSEFARLKQERAEVMVRLQEAREMGDLSENGAYKYAKFELGNIGRQLRQLRHLLANGQPVVVSKSTSGVIAFGSRVTLENEGKKLSFLLVSEHESDPAQNMLSFMSPIGQAIQGRKEGDEVVVETPRGQVSYKIVAVE